MRKILFITITAVFLFGCSKDSEEKLGLEPKGRTVPNFNADRAYQKLAAQVKMGPRNPGSEGYNQAKNYLINQLQKYAGDNNVGVQNFKHVGYNGDTLNLTNIIASFNTKSSDRIMLCAHWDTRPRADRDLNQPQKPILGADDGASGVSVLLELARLFHKYPPPAGVDIILFDGEDYGKEGDLENYFLGSRYWSNNPPVENYHPSFAILLDMVGGRGARFPKEQYSIHYAPALVNEIWSIADQIGYSAVFPNRTGGFVADDHLIINRVQQIPTINIIRHSVNENGEAVFAPYWHTRSDDLDVISKKTLQAVGQVLTELIYNRI